MSLPTFANADDAIIYYRAQQKPNSAVSAYVVASLSRFGMRNREIRAALNISRHYVVSHLKQAGLALSRELIELWNKNSDTLTLRHVRLIARQPVERREELIRTVLERRLSIRKLAAHINDKKSIDPNIARFAQLMSESIGRPVTLEYDSDKQTGTLSLRFFSLDDLDLLARRLGFDPSEHF